MTAHLTGRALDEAVARAMGTYEPVCAGYQDDAGGGWVCAVCRQVTGAWWEDFPKHAKVRAYSTDPRTDAEMLAWLCRNGHRITIDVCGPDVFAITTQLDSLSARGSTISEALAWLVVAVAGREAGA